MFRLVYELVIPGMPLTITNKWEGKLSFELARAEPDEKEPEKKPEGRKPLKPRSETAPSSTASDTTAPANGGAPAAISREEIAARMDAWVKANSREITTDLKTNLWGKIRGTASVTTTSGVAGMVGGIGTKGSGTAKGLTPLEVEGDENPNTQRFEYLTVKGNKYAAQEFTGNFSATGPDGWAKTNAKGSGGQLTTQAEGEDSEGRHGASTTTTNTPVSSGDNLTVLALLQIKQQGITSMSGNVDESFIRQLNQQQGADIKVMESEWKATLDERDPELEKKVKDFLDEPIPPEPDDNYLKEYARKMNELRGDPKRASNYRAQLLAPAVTKLARIRMARARAWTADYPKVSDGATRPVLEAATARLLTELRALELLGVGDDCPDMEKAWSEMTGEIQTLVQKTLSPGRTPTLEELGQFRTPAVMGMLGALTEAYFGAVNTAFQNEHAAPPTAGGP